MISEGTSEVAYYFIIKEKYMESALTAIHGGLKEKVISPINKNY